MGSRLFLRMDVGGAPRELPNDFVWIFAGGIPPNDFLKSINVQFGTMDVTLAASREARQANSREMISA